MREETAVYREFAMDFIPLEYPLYPRILPSGVSNPLRQKEAGSRCTANFQSDYIQLTYPVARAHADTREEEESERRRPRERCTAVATEVVEAAEACLSCNSETYPYPRPLKSRRSPQNGTLDWISMPDSSVY